MLVDAFEEVACAVPLDVPLPLSLFVVVPDTDVFPGVAAAFVVSVPCVPELVVVAAAPVFDARAPAVITTGMYTKSVEERVCVLMPGKLASSPPEDSVQTADLVPAREQSK